MTGDKLSKGQRTQEKILQTTLKLVGQNGFADTSMQMIATACKLSQGAVMQHFPSKLRLFEAVRKHVSQSNHQFVDAQILPTDDSYKALRKHLLLNLEWALKHRAEANIIILTYENAIHEGEGREIALGAVRLGTERIYRYLLAAQREKIVALEKDPEILAQVIHEYLVGIVLRTLSTSKAVKRTQALDQRVDLFLESLLNPAFN